MFCVPPLVYLWDPGEVDPPAVSQPRKFQFFSTFVISAFLSNYRSRRASPHYYGIITSYKSVLHGIQSPTRFHQQQQHQHRPQTFVLETTSMFLGPLQNYVTRSVSMAADKSWSGRLSEFSAPDNQCFTIIHVLARLRQDSITCRITRHRLLHLCLASAWHRIYKG
jgi:hypothetical protein